MMKRRLIAIIVTVAIFVSLVACSKEAETSSGRRKRDVSNNISIDEVKKDSDMVSDNDVEILNDSINQNSDKDVNEKDKEENLLSDNKSNFEDQDLGWQSFYDEFVDTDGYKYSRSLKISGWMKADDTEKINAAWESVAKNKVFSATPSEMGFHNGQIYLNGRSGTYFWQHNWDEVVYAVGYLEVENLTKNYSITSSNTHSIYVNFGTVDYGNEDSIVLSFGNMSPASIKLFYSEPKVIYATQYGGYYQSIRPKMTSDHWKVPFILAFPIDKTPNAPEGDPSPKKCKFIFEGQIFYLPLTWEEGFITGYYNPNDIKDNELKTPENDNKVKMEYEMLTERNQFNFGIDYGFSEDRAWVLLDDRNYYTLALIDTDGRMVYKLKTGDFGAIIGSKDKFNPVVGTTKMYNGYSVIYSTDSTDKELTHEGFIIIDAYGVTQQPLLRSKTAEMRSESVDGYLKSAENPS